METLHSPQSITLNTGSIDEITTALHELGASSTILAQASTSFLVKIPGAVISKIEGGFQVGNSKLWERPSLALGAVTTFRTRAMNAANDALNKQAA